MASDIPWGNDTNFPWETFLVPYDMSETNYATDSDT